MITYGDKIFDSWQDIVDQYPAMWVVFDKAEMKHGQICSGNIVAILPDEEIIAYRDAHLGEVKLSLRTTETVRMTVDLDALIRAREDIGTADRRTNSVTGIGASAAGAAVGSTGGYIHGEIIDA